MKHLRVAKLLERRIHQGDYTLTGIPGERDLADDVGTSRVTLRKALEELERRGLLERASNRRLVLTSRARSKVGRLQIAFASPSIAPASFSPNLQLWLAAVESVARDRGDRVRVINYHHWDDPALTEAIRSFDGVFLVTSSEPIPAWTAEMFTEARCVVALSRDLTPLDVPSIVLFPPRLTRLMMQRLHRLGHRRIDCINIQGHNVVTEARIEAWKTCLREEKLDGALCDMPCNFDEKIYQAGFRVAHKWIRRIDERTTAAFCVTFPAAMGVIRAASEGGISIGARLSVCTIDCESIGKFVHPPIACFHRPDPAECINACLDWFSTGAKRDAWKRPLLLEPKRHRLFEGGSIGPAPK